VVKKDNKIKCKIMREAFEQSLDILGEKGKNVLLRDLSGRLDFSLDEKCPSMDEIEDALKELFGEGATLMTARMQALLDSRKD
jgi:hypothetical protein